MRIAPHPARRRRPAVAGAARPRSDGTPGGTAACPTRTTRWRTASPTTAAARAARTTTRAASASRDLPGPRGEPDERFTLHARHTRGEARRPAATVDALAFDGAFPGPELRVRQGDLVAGHARERGRRRGVTIHWHGVDVPNAEDGVAGVTQDAVAPGGRYVYRFRADQVGDVLVPHAPVLGERRPRGLFGALVDRAAGGRPRTRSISTLVAHHVGRDARSERRRRRRAPLPSPRARRCALRLVNAESTPQRFTVAGTPFRVLAIDGTDLNGPEPIRGADARARGGRPLRRGLHHADAARRLRARRRAGRLALQPGRPNRARRRSRPAPRFDPLGYGRAGARPRSAPTATSTAPSAARSAEARLPRRPARAALDDQRAASSRDVPMFMVKPGDLVKVRSSTTRAARIRCTSTGTTRSSFTATGSRRPAAPGGRTR